MVTRKQIIRDLHLAVEGAACRAVITAAVDSLCDSAPEWRAVRDWRSATTTRQAIEDAIAWRVWQIAGRHLLIRDPEVAASDERVSSDLHDLPWDNLDARASVILGDFQAAGLTRGEYVEWAWSTEVPGNWLSARLGVPKGSLSVPVVRWAARMMAHPDRKAALLRVEERLDEIMPADLRDGVTATLEASEERRALEHWDGPPILTPEDPRDARLPEGVTRLRTVQQMLAEGARMRHCVGDRGYIEAVHRGEAQIFALPDATLEIRKGKIQQLRGFANGVASAEMKRLGEVVRGMWS